MRGSASATGEGEHHATQSPAVVRYETISARKRFHKADILTNNSQLGRAPTLIRVAAAEGQLSKDQEPKATP